MATDSESNKPQDNPKKPTIFQACYGICHAKYAYYKSKSVPSLQGVAAWFLRRIGDAVAPLRQIDSVGFFTAVLCLVAYWQWQALHETDIKIGRQLELVAGQLKLMENDQRPWLTVDAAGTGVTFGKDGSFSAGIQFSVKNVGKTPALGVRITSVIFPRLSGTKSQPDSKWLAVIVPPRSGSEIIAPPIFPNSTFVHQVGMMTGGEDFADKRSRGVGAIVNVTYDSGSSTDSRRQTMIVFDLYRKKDGFLAPIRPEYGDATADDLVIKPTVNSDLSSIAN